MSELDVIYFIIALQAVAMLITTAVYYALRLRIETKKEQSARSSFEAMVTYHSRRLDIETEKLEIARHNGSRPEPKPAVQMSEAEIAEFANPSEVRSA